jgi:hypothetical protein
MKDKSIELIGPVADKARQTASAMKAVGIDPAFGPAACQFQTQCCPKNPGQGGPFRF